MTETLPAVPSDVPEVLTPAIPDDLEPVPVGDPAQHPVKVYLARLAPGSRRSQKAALETMASLLTSGRLNAEKLPWQDLGYQHTQALRAALADRYSPATANRHLAALRGVLREAWRLGLMSAEDLQRCYRPPGRPGRAAAPGPSPLARRAAGTVRVLSGRESSRRP